MSRIRNWLLVSALVALVVFWAFKGTYQMVKGGEHTVWRMNTITGGLELCFPGDPGRIICETD